MRLKYFREVWNIFQIVALERAPGEVWNIFQVVALVLFYVAVGLYTTRSLWTVWVVEDLMNNPGEWRRTL